MFPLHRRACLQLWLGAASALSPPALKRDAEPWKLAQETGAAENVNHIGWSPKPTDAAQPQFGYMDLVKRYSMGTNTCGFVSGYSSAPITCVKFGAYCTHDGINNMDCCDQGVPLETCRSTMYSTCVDYSSSLQGACSSGVSRTICCPSAEPSCYKLLFSTSTEPGKTFSVYQCGATAGTTNLLPEPPALAASTSTTKLTGTGTRSNGDSTTTLTPAQPSNTSNSNSTPIGPIVGGVVGGLGVIAIIIAIVYFVIRNKKKEKASQHSVPLQQQYVEPKYPYGSPGYSPQPPGPQAGSPGYPVEAPGPHPHIFAHAVEAPDSSPSYFSQKSYPMTSTLPHQTLISPNSTNSYYGSPLPSHSPSMHMGINHPPGVQSAPNELPAEDRRGDYWNRAELHQ